MHKLMTLMVKLQPMVMRMMLVMAIVLAIPVMAQVDAGEVTVEVAAPVLPPVASPDLDIPLPPDASMAQLAADPLNIELLSRFVLHAVAERNWGLLASILLAAVLAALRKFIPAETAVGKWLKTKLGILIANLLLSLATSFALLFLGGGVISWAMVLKALTMSITASGSWSIWKNVNEAIEERKAQTAGTAAAAAPTSTLDK